jgi:crossover junction endodeoxyribonuclease RuvC
MAKAPPSRFRIIGIDPGLNLTGYGMVELQAGEISICEAGVIRLPRSDGDNLPDRLAMLFRELSELLEEFQPQQMCLEEVYSHAFYPQTAILMSHARGVICLAAAQAGIPVASLPAKRIKQSVTGNGSASKLQVQCAVRQFFSLDRTPHPPDVADALASALCYAHSLRHGVALAQPPRRVRAPKAQAAALSQHSIFVPKPKSPSPLWGRGRRASAG